VHLNLCPCVIATKMSCLCFRDVFACPILFSLWHIRRTWLKIVIKKCSNSEVQREIFVQLGKIMYNIWSEKNPMDAVEQLLQDFIDQTTFVKYFKSYWVPKLGKN
jgi:hypothetical protein